MEEYIERIKIECERINDTIMTFRSKKAGVYEVTICKNISLPFLFQRNRELVIKGNENFLITKFSDDIYKKGNEGKSLFAPTVTDFKDYQDRDLFDE